MFPLFPFPLKLITVVGKPLVVLPVRVMVPVVCPGPVGVNVTLIEQLLCAPMVPQLLVWAKSPVIAIPEMLTGALPALVTVTAWAGLLVPTL